MPDVFVERTFELRGAGGDSPVTLRLARPERDPARGGSWRCRVVITGLPHAVDQYAYGEDGLQALGLGLELARAYLEYAPLEPGQALTLFGAPDLDLPRSLPAPGAA